MRTIDKIITPLDCRRGAPMGRANVDNREVEEVCGILYSKTNGKIYDCAVPLDNGGYDRGGAYWGHGRQLRVRYTKDLKFVDFYRLGE